MKIYLKLFGIFFLSFFSLCAQQKSLTFEDIMKFKQIKNPVISDNGNWIAFSAVPDRGNAEAVIRSIDGITEYKYERGSDTKFSNDEKWAVIKYVPDFAEAEKNEKEKDALKNDLIVLNTANGDTLFFPRVINYDISENSNWIAIHYYPEEEKDSSKKKDEKKKDLKPEGSQLTLLNLSDQNKIELENVINFSFDSLSTFFAYSKGDTSGATNGLFLKALKNPEKEITVLAENNSNFSEIKWNNKSRLAFLKSTFDEKGKSDSSILYLWNRELTKLLDSENADSGWMLPANNFLSWNEDGSRLFFGFKPIENEERKSEDTLAGIYDYEKILAKKELNVWHFNDPLIKTHEAKEWKNKKDQTYSAVFNFNAETVTSLADLDVPYIYFSKNGDRILARSDLPYQKEITWDDSYNDFYIIDLNNGKREKIIEHLSSTAFLSPGKNFLAYYKDKNWFLFDIENKSIKNLTKNIDNIFYNGDNDIPASPSGYGIAGWLENDDAVLIYDKFDVWEFSTRSDDYKNSTNGFGRKNKVQFRIQKTDKKSEFFKSNDNLLLSGYDDVNKNSSFFSLNLSTGKLTKLLEEKMKYTFISKPKESRTILFTKETYSEYPDLWITDDNFLTVKKLTNFGNQTNGFAWGEAELVEWQGLDGTPLQGVLIKPGNYAEGKKYPVLVYYYELFSQRLYEFNEMVVNHRPNFPFYASNGYCVFLPDIRFTEGQPGYSAVQCLLPGVQNIVDMGIADLDAIALHGHSWSGYETAFVITQTDIFACAIAGAPVANMTSAYSGIRWGTGLARQFQYEKSQSRIGGSLWEAREKYIQNSPVFFADKITTPLLIEHGDEDEAVPWYQSIELYLAMRRLGKDAIFLQYKGEPHHLKKYANKLDYSIKMKEYLDHYLKGMPAAEWITEGVPYSE